VLELNEQEVFKLAPMDADRLEELHGWCHRFDVVEVDGGFGGFVIVFAPGSAYDGDYYRFFGERFTDFLYLDRIVLEKHVRRRGVGAFVYDELEAVAAEHGRMTLEVNVEPPNPPSLAFHEGRGYVEVGRGGPEGHVVSLMVKSLPS